MPPPSPPNSPLKTSLPSAHAASSSSLSPVPDPDQLLSPSRKKTFLHNNPGTEPRHLAIALHHAQQIQSQKDSEALILSRILDLVSFPPSPSADPAAPSAQDAAVFKHALIPFQPSDYDNLVRERNIEGLCGYVLCPREHRTDDAGGGAAGYRIVWGAKGSGPGGRGREMNIVPREKLEMWCSDECAERAMYVRVQLAEEPVWERRAGDARATEISLLEEARAAKETGKGKGKQRETASTDVAEGVGRLDIRDDSRTDALAQERGDSSQASQGGRVDIQIKEKENVRQSSVKAPELHREDREGGSIEGHVPKERRDARDVDRDDKEDLLDQF